MWGQEDGASWEEGGHRAEEEGEGSVVSAGGCCSPGLTIPQPHGQCLGPGRGVIPSHKIVLAENGVAPWAGAETAASEAGAHLGQSMSSNPSCYIAGTVSRSVTQVFVLLREVVLLRERERAGG